MLYTYIYLKQTTKKEAAYRVAAWVASLGRYWSAIVLAQLFNYLHSCPGDVVHQSCEQDTRGEVSLSEMAQR